MNTATNEIAADRLLPISEVELRVGLKKSAIYERMDGNTFPKAIKIGSASRWSEQAIQHWIKQQLAANDGALSA